MENKSVGILIIAIGFIVGIIVLIFNYTNRQLVDATCSHGLECTMYSTLTLQMWMSLSIVAIILVIGFVIMFTKPKERIVIQKVKVKEKKKRLNLKGLDKDEKRVIDFLMKEGKAVFQADLKEKLEIGKVKTTRLLDKLEAKQLIERKRRGMNNIVVLRD
jgi:uncharacterized membrane protein